MNALTKRVFDIIKIIENKHFIYADVDIESVTFFEQLDTMCIEIETTKGVAIIPIYEMNENKIMVTGSKGLSITVTNDYDDMSLKNEIMRLVSQTLFFQSHIPHDTLFTYGFIDK